MCEGQGERKEGLKEVPMWPARQTLTYAAVAVLAGAGGLLIGLLYAPVSGREARRMAARRVNDGVETLERTGRRALADIKQNLEHKVEAGREAFAHVARG
jgi:hypothetical protein